MNDSPKIQLSPFEQQLITNYEWLLTKNAILEKIKDLLAGLQQRQHDLLMEDHRGLPAEIISSSGKISKGENYLGLPYLVLDQPRFFDRDNVFAVRTMFWWGHFFSTTLQLAGTYRDQFLPQLKRSFAYFRTNDFYINHHTSPWNHHFGEDNYRPLQELNETEYQELLTNHPFVKLAKKISLDNWDTIEKTLTETFESLMKVLSGRTL